MNPNAQFERELERWLQAEAPASAPDGLHAAVIDRARTMRQRRSRVPLGLARWLGRGRGVMLLAAASLLLLGGVAAAGAGMLRFPAVVPPVPAPVPTLPVAIASPATVPSAGPSASAVPSASALILFKARTEGTNGPLWAANGDGTGKHELIPGSCQGWPSWSPDGTRLLISRIDPPGDHPTEDSPCGFFVDLGDAGTRLYLTDASGTAPQMVDTGCVDPCVSDSHGVFSGDGRRILFIRWVNGDPAPWDTGIAGKPAPPTQVWVLATKDLETGRVTELAHLPAGSGVPAWAPDGTQIVFNWELPVPPNSSDSIPPAAEVLVADAGGRNVHRVSPSGWESGTASWSPDGSLILFMRNDGTLVGDPYRASSDIYTVRPDGTDVRRLTTDGLAGNPAWSVDGRIWFIRTPSVEGNAQAPLQQMDWIMDADGGNATQSSLGPQPQDLADTARQPTP